MSLPSSSVITVITVITDAEVASAEMKKNILNEVKEVLREKVLQIALVGDGLSFSKLIPIAFKIDMYALTIEALREILKEIDNDANTSEHAD
jgi:hypothetical protein